MMSFGFFCFLLFCFFLEVKGEKQPCQGKRNEIDKQEMKEKK